MERIAIWTPPAGARHVALSPAMTRAAVLITDTIVIMDPGTNTITAIVPADDAAWVAVRDDGTVVATISADREVRVIPVTAPADARTLGVLCGARDTAACDATNFRDDTLFEPEQLVFASQGDLMIVSERRFDDLETYYGGGSLTGEATTWVARWSTGAAQALTSDRHIGNITYTSRDEEVYPDYPTAAVWSPRAGHLALISRKRGAVTVYRRVDDTWHAAPRAPHDQVRAAAFTPDETTLLLACGTRVIRWNIERGEEHGALVTASEVHALAPAPADPRLAILDSHGVVTLLGDAPELLPQAHPSPARRIAWPDDLHIRHADGTLHRWR
jgi:hypothetical protein